MRKIDGKFSTDGTKVFNTVSGEEIPEDEPVLLLRARDRLALGTLLDYRERAILDGCNELHLAGINQVVIKFERWQTANQGKMKQPGETRHLKLEEGA